MARDVEAAKLILPSDEMRAGERERLLASAAKHCADAYAFGRYHSMYHRPGIAVMDMMMRLSNPLRMQDWLASRCFVSGVED